MWYLKTKRVVYENKNPGFKLHKVNQRRPLRNKSVIITNREREIEHCKKKNLHPSLLLRCPLVCWVRRKY